MAVFWGAEQTDWNIFPVAVNIQRHFRFSREESCDKEEFEDTFTQSLSDSLWHEAGHGLYRYILDLVLNEEDKTVLSVLANADLLEIFSDRKNEESVVEDFARYPDSPLQLALNTLKTAFSSQQK